MAEEQAEGIRDKLDRDEAVLELSLHLLDLMADPPRLKQAVKDLADAARTYAQSKAAAAAVAKREGEVFARETDAQKREAAVQVREDAMDDREAKIRAALA